MIEIGLHNNKHPNLKAIIDDEDFDLVSRYKWYLSPSYGTGYAQAETCYNKKSRKHIKMHRLILSAPSSLQVDHIDGNGLNNRKSNLRLVTQTEQQRNRGKRKGTSKFKGVVYYIRDGNWMASIRINKKLIHLGYYSTEEEAAKVYDIWAEVFFGEHAHLNFVGGKINDRIFGRTS